MHRYLAILVALLLAPLSTFAQAPATPAQPAARAVAGEVSFVAGRVRAGEGASARELRVGDPVREGDRLSTGAGGHLHVKTVDGGFLALRPDSRARVDVYAYDPAAPSATRIRLVLESGVMRAVSGSGAQAARDKFRLNTPVAAIGIRGTDFTVSTTDSLTRAVVQRGAIVVSAFGADCRPEALGPCGGSAVRALSGDEAGKLLELRRGQREPQLIDVRPNSGAPDQIAPPASSEPRASSGSSQAASSDRGTGSPDRSQLPGAPLLDQRAAALTTETLIAGQVGSAVKDAGAAAGAGAVVPPAAVATPPVALVPADPVVVAPPAPVVTWGRWATIAGLPAPTGLDAFIAQNGPMAAINRLYALSVSNTENMRMPETGSFDFKLDRYEAWTTESGTVTGMAAVQNGQLNVNFGQQRFSTSLDVNAQGALATLRSQGQLTADGKLSGALVYSDTTTNMNVRGALGGTQATTAGYVFDAMLNQTRGIVGATSWSR